MFAFYRGRKPCKRPLRQTINGHFKTDSPAGIQIRIASRLGSEARNGCMNSRNDLLLPRLQSAVLRRFDWPIIAAYLIHGFDLESGVGEHQARAPPIGLQASHKRVS